MTALPRGRCPRCQNEVALRKGGLVREHRAERTCDHDSAVERYAAKKAAAA